ncbi:MAG: DUF6452 family protein [Gelidibacter sp.]
MKQIFPYKIILFLLIIIGTWSCERDDICAESTSTTPHLIIRFYDINNQTTLKNARNLTVTGEGATEDILYNKTVDSIVLPLKFDSENTTNTTRFVLEKNTDYRLDTNPLTNSNVDIIEVKYTPQFVFVSRACGYKAIFTDLQISRDADDDNWIINTEVINPTIENENAAHINIYH